MYQNVAVTLNLEDVPTTLANATGITTVEVAGIFCTLLLMLLVTIPFLIARITILVVPASIFAFFMSVGMGWLAGWLVMVVVLLTAGLASFGFIKGMWT